MPLLSLLILASCGEGPGDKARELVEVGMFEDARGTLQTAIRENPQDAGLHLLLGRTWLQEAVREGVSDERLSSARESFSRAIQLDTGLREDVAGLYREAAESALAQQGIRHSSELAELAADHIPDAAEELAGFYVERGRNAFGSADEDRGRDLFRLASSLHPPVREEIGPILSDAAAEALRSGAEPGRIEPLRREAGRMGVEHMDRRLGRAAIESVLGMEGQPASDQLAAVDRLSRYGERLDASGRSEWAGAVLDVAERVSSGIETDEFIGVLRYAARVNDSARQRAGEMLAERGRSRLQAEPPESESARTLLVQAREWAPDSGPGLADRVLDRLNAELGRLPQLGRDAFLELWALANDLDPNVSNRGDEYAAVVGLGEYLEGDYRAARDLFREVRDGGPGTFGEAGVALARRMLAPPEPHELELTGRSSEEWLLPTVRAEHPLSRGSGLYVHFIRAETTADSLTLYYRLRPKDEWDMLLYYPETAGDRSAPYLTWDDEEGPEQDVGRRWYCEPGFRGGEPSWNESVEEAREIRVEPGETKTVSITCPIGDPMASEVEFQSPGIWYQHGWYSGNITLKPGPFEAE